MDLQIINIKNIDIDYQEYQKRIEKEFVIESTTVKSDKVLEEIKYYYIRHINSHLKETPILFLLHGLRDNSVDWITRGRILENYLYLLDRREIDGFDIVLVDSGYDGMSWYSDFYKKKYFWYEQFFIEDVVKKIVKEQKKVGIAGFSMGGYGALKLGIKYDFFDTIGSFAGAINISRIGFNLKNIPFLEKLYIPKFLFSKDKRLFLEIFSSYGKKILENNPYNMLKKMNDTNEKRIYMSVGDKDLAEYYMLPQCYDVYEELSRMKSKGEVYICENEEHTWEYVSRDIKNFFKYFSKNNKLTE